MKRNLICRLLLATAICLSTTGTAQIITTLAGTDSTGYNGDNIPATAARLNCPVSVATDKAGDLYIADNNGMRIRKVSAGIITTIAGTGTEGYSGDGGPGTAADVNSPLGIVADDAGNVYFSDVRNNCIRRINADGIITRFAGDTGMAAYGYSGDGGAATAAKLYGPSHMVIGADGSIYFTDASNFCVRKVNRDGIISTAYAGFTRPTGIAFDKAGNFYVVDYDVVKKVTTTGAVTTIAGGGKKMGLNIGDGGPATAATLNLPEGIVVDGDGNIYIADTYNRRIRKVNTSGIITSIAGVALSAVVSGGDGGYASLASVGGVHGLAFDRSGNLLIADAYRRIRMIRYALATPMTVQQEMGVVLYPNPSDGVFTIEVTDAGNEEVAITIVNIAGQKVKELTTTTNTATKMELHVQGGLYSVIATTPTKRWVQQIVIK